jgi:hypothetical protein
MQRLIRPSRAKLGRAADLRLPQRLAARIRSLSASASHRNFYKVEKWSRMGRGSPSCCSPGGNGQRPPYLRSHDQASAARIRLATRVLRKWPDERARLVKGRPALSRRPLFSLTADFLKILTK